MVKGLARIQRSLISRSERVEGKADGTQRR